MAAVVEQTLAVCSRCGRETIHSRNGTQMNWLMHLVLTLFTAGLWLPVFALALLFRVLFQPVGGWRCMTCGK